MTTRVFGSTGLECAFRGLKCTKPGKCALKAVASISCGPQITLVADPKQACVSSTHQLRKMPWLTSWPNPPCDKQSVRSVRGQAPNKSVKLGADPLLALGPTVKRRRTALGLATRSCLGVLPPVAAARAKPRVRHCLGRASGVKPPLNL